MNNVTSKSFGAILVDARASTDMSLGDAAKLLGVPKTSLWRWENNENKMDAQRLVDIVAAYGLSISASFEGKTLKAPTQTDLGRLGDVVEHIELIIQGLLVRLNPKALRTAVVEVLQLETTRVLETRGSTFDPSRYDAMMSSMLGQTS